MTVAFSIVNYDIEAQRVKVGPSPDGIVVTLSFALLWVYRTRYRDVIFFCLSLLRGTKGTWWSPTASDDVYGQILSTDDGLLCVVYEARCVTAGHTSGIYFLVETERNRSVTNYCICTTITVIIFISFSAHSKRQY